MDFREIKDGFKDRIKNFVSPFSGSKKRIFLVSGILVFMTVCAVFVLAFSFSGKKESSPQGLGQRKINAEEKFLVPSGPEVPYGYETSRKTEEAWSEDEAEEWFAFPDENEIRRLGESNDRMIDEITGAAP